MKATFFRCVLILVIVSLMSAGMVSYSSASNSNQFQSTATPVPTRTGVPTPAIQVAPGIPVDILTFESLATPDTALNGPFDSMTLSFSLPADWQLVDGTELRLIVSASAVTSGAAAPDTNQTLGATLDVSFNGQLITSVVLEQGVNREYRIPIPANALRSDRDDGRNTIYLFLNAGIDCDFAFHKTTIIIGGQSKIFLPHVKQSLPLDIGLFPRPIFQRDSIIPSQVAIVIPKQPSADGLRAGLVVSAGLSRMTGSELKVTFITANELTEEIRNNYHLIFVGKPIDFMMLAAFAWPAPINGSVITTGGLQADDGVLQIITSPWNAARTILWVGGNSDVGVVKSAQALSTGAVRPLAERNKVVIADTKPFAARLANAEIPVEHTFTALGYDVETLSGTGFGQMDYSFYVPPGMIPSERPYIDLFFSNSSLMDVSSSGLVVSVNDVQVASERLDDTTSSLATKRITISTNLIHMGLNVISIQATLIPLQQCSLFTANNLWLTIYPDSILHMPLIEAPVTGSSASVLNNYPESFTGYPDLQQLTFVVPQGSPTAWRVASQVAYDLGSRVRGALFEFGIVYDGQIPAGVRENHDVFLIGLPNSLPSIAELQTVLPIPFASGNSLTLVQGQNIAYRVPPEVPLGYLELMPSPWGKGYTVLAVLGSNDEGLGWAGDALANPDQKRNLFGNFAVVSDQDVVSVDTRTGAGLSGLTAGLNAIATPVLLDKPLGAATPQPGVTGLQGLLTRTDYIPSIVGVIIFGIVVILFVVYRSSRKSKKKN